MKNVISKQSLVDIVFKFLAKKASKPSEDESDSSDLPPPEHSFKAPPPSVEPSVETPPKPSAPVINTPTPVASVDKPSPPTSGKLIPSTSFQSLVSNTSGQTSALILNSDLGKRPAARKLPKNGQVNNALLRNDMKEMKKLHKKQEKELFNLLSDFNKEKEKETADLFATIKKENSRISAEESKRFEYFKEFQETLKKEFDNHVNSIRESTEKVVKDLQKDLRDIGDMKVKWFEDSVKASKNASKIKKEIKDSYFCLLI